MKKLKFVFLTALTWLFISGIASAETPIKVKIDGVLQSYDQPPILENNRTLVPLRGIFESLGAKVEYNAESQEINASKEATTVWLKIGSKTTKVNGITNTLDVPARTKSGRTLVPLRFIGETLGCIVEWNGNSRTVLIFTSEQQQRLYNENIAKSGINATNPVLKQVASIYENAECNFVVKVDKSNRFAVMIDNEIHVYSTGNVIMYNVGVMNENAEKSLEIGAEVISVLTGISKDKILEMGETTLSTGEPVTVGNMRASIATGYIIFSWK